MNEQLRPLSTLGGRTRISRISGMTALLVFVLTALLGVTCNATAQVATNLATLTGQVSNSGTGDYLDGAQVTVEGTGKTVFTDRQGRYIIRGLTPGQYKVQTTYTGLDPLEQSVTLEAGVSRTLDFGLTTKVYTLSQFVVAGQREGNAAAITAQKNSSNLKNVVSADAFGDVTEGNVGEFLKSLPGVQVNYVAADVRSVEVRGMADNFTRVTFDGNQMASSSSSKANRTFEFEQVSINNVETVEVTKEPTPAMPGDSLGGSVNFVSKSAFDEKGTRLNYRAYLSANSEDLTLKQTPGWDDQLRYKVYPGVDASFSTVVKGRVGININYLNSNQFNEQHRSQAEWKYTTYKKEGIDPGPNIDPNSYDPSGLAYMKRQQIQDGPKFTHRASASANLDFKLSDTTTLSVDGQWNDYESQFRNRNLRFVPNHVAPGYDRNHVESLPGKGYTEQNGSFNDKMGTTEALNFRVKHQWTDSSLDYGLFYSTSSNHYANTEHGFFENITGRYTGLTLDLTNLQSVHPIRKELTGKDVYNLANYTSKIQAQARKRVSRDDVTGGKINYRKSFTGGDHPWYIQAGLSYKNQNRHIHIPRNIYDYVGPTDSSGNPIGDNSLAQFKDSVYQGVSPYFGYKPWDWPDPYKAYQLFKEHPEYFKLEEAKAVKYSATSKQDISEAISAAYLMGHFDFGRLSVLTGVRFERTGDDGYGYKYDANAIYKHDVQGNLVRDTNGDPILLTTDPGEQARLQYAGRTHRTSSYNDLFPSIHFKYNATRNLVFRMSAGRTIGRPNFSNIIPGMDVEESTAQDGLGSVTLNNTDLKPQRSTNFDIDAEYYFEPVGVISLGYFHKDLSDYIADVTTTIGDGANNGFNGDYAGYTLHTQVNSGKAKFDGIEFNYSQQLSFLPGWLGGFGVFGNLTYLQTKGTYGGGFQRDHLQGFKPLTANYGFSYDRNPLSLEVKWNYQGNYLIQDGGSYNGTMMKIGENRYRRARLMMDVNLEYKFSRKFAIFVNGRNVLNAPEIIDSWSNFYRQEEFGVQYTAGIKGRF